MWKKIPNLTFLLIACSIFLSTYFLGNCVLPKSFRVPIMHSAWYLSTIVCIVAIGCLIKSICDRKKDNHIKFVRLQKS